MLWVWGAQGVQAASCAGTGGLGGCTLLHQRSHPEPEAVQQGEVVLHDVRARVAGVSVVPLVWAEPAGTGAARAR